MINCDTTKKMCMYDECAECKTVQFSTFDGMEKVTFTEWTTAEKVRRERWSYHCQDHSEENTQDYLVELFHNLLHDYKRHPFNINQQYSYSKAEKKLSKGKT